MHHDIVLDSSEIVVNKFFYTVLSLPSKIQLLKWVALYPSTITTFSNGEEVESVKSLVISADGVSVVKDLTLKYIGVCMKPINNNLTFTDIKSAEFMQMLMINDKAQGMLGSLRHRAMHG